MRVARWGNSLAVRIPADVAAELGVSEGDEVTLKALARGEIGVSADDGWQEALAEIKRLSRPLPPGYEFDREEANAR